VYGVSQDIAGVTVQIGVFLDLALKVRLEVSAAGTLTTGARGPIVWRAFYKYDNGNQDYSFVTDDKQFAFIQPRLTLDASKSMTFVWLLCSS
jgi:hypothetical protein